MKLAVLEYNGYYTAGTIVAIVEKIEDLNILIKSDYLLVLDEEKGKWHQLLKNLIYNNDFCEYMHVCEIDASLRKEIDKYAPDSLTEKWFYKIKSKIDIDEDDRGRIYNGAFDLSTELDDGLYLVETFDLPNEEKARIVSWTYNSG